MHNHKLGLRHGRTAPTICFSRFVMNRPVTKQPGIISTPRKKNKTFPYTILHVTIILRVPSHLDTSKLRLLHFTK